jgi:hypothetical protein
MADSDTLRDAVFHDSVYRESYSHYRHLETLRKDHLNTFLVMNAAVVALLSATGGVGAYIQANSRLAAIGLGLIGVIAFVFYFVSRIGEEARNQHQVVMEKITRFRLGPDNVWETSFRGQKQRRSSPSARILDKIGMLRVSVLMLLPYLTIMWAYVLASTFLATQVFGPECDIWAILSLGAPLIATICAVLCTVDFFSFLGRRDLVPA